MRLTNFDKFLLEYTNTSDAGKYEIVRGFPFGDARCDLNDPVQCQPRLIQQLRPNLTVIMTSCISYIIIIIVDREFDQITLCEGNPP
jgi:hypothetical protein